MARYTREEFLKIYEAETAKKTVMQKIPMRRDENGEIEYAEIKVILDEIQQVDDSFASWITTLSPDQLELLSKEIEKRNETETTNR